MSFKFSDFEKVSDNGEILIFQIIEGKEAIYKREDFLESVVSFLNSLGKKIEKSDLTFARKLVVLSYNANAPLHKQCELTEAVVVDHGELIVCHVYFPMEYKMNSDEVGLPSGPREIERIKILYNGSVYRERL